MLVGMLEIELRLAGPRSLKEKRHLIRGLIERIRSAYHVSISEVGDHDLWGNATIGVAHVSDDAHLVESVLDKVLTAFESHPELNLFAVWREVERRKPV